MPERTEVLATDLRFSPMLLSSAIHVSSFEATVRYGVWSVSFSNVEMHEYFCIYGDKEYVKSIVWDQDREKIEVTFFFLLYFRSLFNASSCLGLRSLNNDENDFLLERGSGMFGGNRRKDFAGAVSPARESHRE